MFMWRNLRFIGGKKTKGGRFLSSFAGHQYIKVCHEKLTQKPENHISGLHLELENVGNGCWNNTNFTKT